MGGNPFLLSIASVAFVFLFLQPHLTSSCDISTFYCGTNSNNSVKPCGRSKIRCENSSVLIQFYGQGQWYSAASIQYPERVIRIWDTNTNLLSQLENRDCDFIYNFTTPIQKFHPSHIESLDPNFTFFNCTPDTYDFSRDVFGKSTGSPFCKDYDLLYTYRPKKPPPGGTCFRKGSDAVEMELMFEDDGAGAVSFFLRSIGYSSQRALDPQCFSCNITGGLCSAIKEEEHDSSCSCRHDHKCPRKSATRSRNLVIGFSVAGSLLLLACAAIVLFWRRRLKRLSSSMRSLFRSSSSEVSSHGKDPESFSSSYYQTPMFSYKELEDATGGFDPSKELGDGGFGTVYKGKLKDGRIVAVKRLYENNFRRMQQFRNEVEILNRLRHQNLVTLYGCTPKDSPKLMLVYEFVSNGTVADHLHGPRSGERILTWALRMSIATETAEALAYLHAVQPQIVHRDVKTSNILLDTDLHVKVADFGLSRLFPTPAATHVSTAPQGTPGYLDPEYHQCYHLTDKSDVYSFGVVLVELLTSMPAVDITRDRNEINLSNIALSRIPQGRVGEIVDPGLGYGSDCEVRRMVGEVAEIAFRCLQGERDLRPTMDEVLQLLKSIAAGGPCGGMEVKAPPSKVKSSNNNVIVQVDDKQARDDTYLLDSPPFSPDSDGVIEWPSRSTTPSTSQ